VYVRSGLNEVITVRLDELKNAFRARTSSTSPCRVLVACIPPGPLHLAHRVSSERGTDGDLLGDIGGLHHAQMVVARPHAGNDGVDTRSSCTGQAFRSMTIIPPTLTEDHPVSFSIEGARGLVSGSFLVRTARKVRPVRRIPKNAGVRDYPRPLRRCGIDDAVSDHLDRAVKCDQRGRAGCGDGIAGPHESIPVADEAARSTVESAQECGVVRAMRPDFTSCSMALN